MQGPARASGTQPAPRVPRQTLAGLACTPLLLAALTLVSPHLSVPPGWLDAVTFAGGASLALGSLLLLSRDGLSPRAQWGLGATALCVWCLAALLPASPVVASIAVGTALVTVGHLVGDAVGARIEHPGHLLPACVVAGAVDITSVLHPAGPSHAVVASERALSLMTLSFPVLGTAVLAPVLGVGDMLFVALLLGTARKHGLSRGRVSVLAAAGVALAGLVSAWWQSAVPALPAIGLATILGMPAARALRAKDRRVAAVFMVGTVVIASVTIALRFLSPGDSP